MTERQKEGRSQGNIWIISEGRYLKRDVTRLLAGKDFGPVKEYRVSQIGRYLLNPLFKLLSAARAREVMTAAAPSSSMNPM